MDTIRTYIIALALLLLLGGIAFGQEVRHYQSDIVATEDGNLLQQHLLINSNGDMGVVVMTGPAGTQPVAVGLSGPRIYTDVDDDGNAAFCFAVEAVEGFQGTDGNRFIGQVACYVWSGADDDLMYETGDTPFGEQTSMDLRWCGERHLPPAPDAPMVRS